MSIIISQDGKNAQRVDKSEFEKEGYLQNYIHENPESIPVYEIEEDKKLFVVAREFLTESGPIDALAIDKDGKIVERWTGDYVFDNEWQSFRTKKNRNLELVSASKEVTKGTYKVAVKVVDIFGNDTTRVIEVNI